ncbi:hypothetical protein MMC10_008587 [Thelotrema lepadinum]|nr:hypothetical protein [Thelotrema lepadinum]
MAKKGRLGISHNKDESSQPAQPSPKRDWTFWTIFFSLCILGFAAALDGSIIYTALPTITTTIGGESQYVWIVNAYALASTVVQPFVGQTCNVFGRRYPALISVALFAIGAGLAGGATSIGMLIAGRSVQGLGAGGIFVLVEIIICDLVSQRERGKYLGYVLGATAVGSTSGPLIGGALALASWRWVFYITIPSAAFCFVWMFFFLKLKRRQSLNLSELVYHLDIVGNFIFIASITAILLGLVMGGIVFPWSSANIIVPLVLGFAGWAGFHVYEGSKLCTEPTVPFRLFNQRNTAIGYFLSFLIGIFLAAPGYFLPLYFQAVQGTSPLISGVNTLPLNVFMMAVAGVSGAIMTKTGWCRPLHGVALAFIALGFGLLGILDANSSVPEWLFFQVFVATGIGSSFVTILPAIQAFLLDSDTATSTGLYSFVRSFGIVWGSTIPSVIFNSQINANLGIISDPNLRSLLANGAAYQFAASVSSLPSDQRAQAVALYTKALKPVWLVLAGFAVLGFLLVFLEKPVHLRQDIITDFGIDRPEEEKVRDMELGSPRSPQTPSVSTEALHNMQTDPRRSIHSDNRRSVHSDERLSVQVDSIRSMT